MNWIWLDQWAFFQAKIVPICNLLINVTDFWGSIEVGKIRIVQWRGKRYCIGFFETDQSVWVSSFNLEHSYCIVQIPNLVRIFRQEVEMWQPHLPLRRTKGFGEPPAQLSPGLTHSLQSSIKLQCTSQILHQILHELHNTREANTSSQAWNVHIHSFNSKPLYNLHYYTRRI